MSTIEVTVPEMGDFDEVEVIEVLVKPGDVIKAEQSLVTVESDKASMEIPSAIAGTLLELKVKLGDKVKKGSLLALVESPVADGSASARSAAPAAAPTAAPAAAPATAPTASPAASPAPGAAEPPAPVQPRTQTATGQASDVSTHPIEAKAERIEVHVPEMGDFDQVEVIEILVSPGDTVALEQSLLTVESDKASMEIPSSAQGVVETLLVKLGDRVKPGSPIAVIARTAQAVTPAQAPVQADLSHASSAVSAPAPLAPEAAPAAPLAQPEAGAERDRGAAVAPLAALSTPAPAGGDAALPHASPSVRQFARELGVDLSRVAGSAEKGRITRNDVQTFVKAQLVQLEAPQVAPSGTKALGGSLNLLPWPSLDFARFGATETVALSRIKKISGPNLARNWAMIPHVTQFDEADITELEVFRRQTNEHLEPGATKVTLLAFVMKACSVALKRYPNFNSSLDGDGANLILKKYIHLGFAADTPQGLVVPVIRDCDQKSITRLAQETAELAAKAREGKLAPAEMQGASFTISSLGGVGGTAFTPIINAPEVAILGLSRSETKPFWDGAAFVPRLKLPLSLSYDHRVVDGAQAARFTTYLCALLADLRRVLL